MNNYGSITIELQTAGATKEVHLDEDHQDARKYWLGAQSIGLIAAAAGYFFNPTVQISGEILVGAITAISGVELTTLDRKQECSARLKSASYMGLKILTGAGLVSGALLNIPVVIGLAMAMTGGTMVHDFYNFIRRS